LSSLYFLLLPNFGREWNPYLDRSWIDQQYWNGFDPSWMEIAAVTTPAGEELPYSLEESPPELQTYSLKDTLLRVALPRPLAPGQTVGVKIEFTTKFPHAVTGDGSYHRGIYTWRFGWHPIAVPTSELAGGRYLAEEKEYYRFELPAARYEAELTLPADYVLASGADEQEVIGEEEGWTTFRLRSDAPVRSLPFSAGPEFKLYRLETSIPIEVYYLPGHGAAARLLATYAAEILDRYQELYGPYGGRRLVIVESSARGLFGMAADGFIILGNSAFGEKDLGLEGMADRLLEYLLAHEIAHQWSGIGVGADFNAENFLSEAFAQYLSVSYFEERYGSFGPNLFVFSRPGLLEKLIEHELGFYNLRQHLTELPYIEVVRDRFDEAIVKPQKEVEYGNWSYIRIYDKGYLVLRALAGWIGRERMAELIRRAYREYDHLVLTVAGLRRLAEEVSGRDLQGFFRSWLYGADFVDYWVKNVQITPINGGYRAEIALARRGGAALPVEVVAVTAEGEEIVRVWDAQAPEGTIRIESRSPVKSVKVDPEELTPDVNRLDNFYPMKLRVITTGKRDLPLDAYLLRFDPATQILEGGTLWHRWWLGQGVGAFAVRGGRGSLTRGLVDLRPLGEYGTIVGELELTLTGFSNPPVGSPAKFWEPTDRWSFSIRRMLDPTDGRGINYLGLTWTRSEAVRDLYTTELSLVGYPLEPRFGRLSLRSRHLFRLMPHLYLAEEINLGLGYRLPGPLQFALDELHSFYGRTDEGRWEKRRYPGNAKLYGRFSLSLPVRREMDYDLANLAVIDEVRETLFIAGGWTGKGPTDLSFRGLRLEAGLEGRFAGRTLGGLFPFAITLGFAYPLAGIEPENRRGQVYLGVQLPSI